MASRMPPTRRPSEEPRSPQGDRERELIVVVDATAQLQTVRGAPASAAGANMAPVAAALQAASATMRPLFPRAAAAAAEARAARSRGAAASSAAADGATGGDAAAAAELSSFFRVDAPAEQLESLAATLREQPHVVAAYVKPPAEPARVNSGVGSTRYDSGVSAPDQAGQAQAAPLNTMLPAPEEAPPATPSFVSRQLYLNPAPGGIDAFFAWTQPGGSGAGVRVIDIEGAWRFGHEDLVVNQGGLAGGTASPDIGWRNHGTAVIGEIGGDRNAFGITGICPDALVRGISIFGGPGSAGAIVQAANALAAGDIILIELHRPGPEATGVGQQGFIAIEWWPDDYAAIRYATGRGVIVVEAAGNGAVNLDAPIYNTPGPGFPAGWSNPFRRGARDSGAVLVGAGAPPPGTHGRNWGPDRSRLDFSNYGSAVDAQGWGREVTTAGYGDLQGGANEDLWYTDQFSGTSSASPIVVGAIGCVQGNRRARGLPLLSPQTARDLLRSTGTPQQASAAAPLAQRIGNRPDLRQLLGGGVTLAVPLFRYWNPINTDHFYTTNWNELGWGKSGWALEGTQCYVFRQAAPGTVRLFRYWNAAIGDHFYTTNWSELGGGAHGWVYEGVQCHVYPVGGAGRIPLYRYWNPTIGDHFYTTNWGELGAGKHGWRYEGIQCYVRGMPAPPAAGAPGDADWLDGMGPDVDAPDINASADGSDGDGQMEQPDVGPVTRFTAGFTEGATGQSIPDTFRTVQDGSASDAKASHSPGETRTGAVSFTITVHRDSGA